MLLHRTFADLDAYIQEFALNPFRPPGVGIRYHLANECGGFIGNSR